MYPDVTPGGSTGCQPTIVSGGTNQLLTSNCSSLRSSLSSASLPCAHIFPFLSLPLLHHFLATWDLNICSSRSATPHSCITALGRGHFSPVSSPMLDSPCPITWILWSHDGLWSGGVSLWACGTTRDSSRLWPPPCPGYLSYPGSCLRPLTASLHLSGNVRLLIIQMVVSQNAERRHSLSPLCHLQTHM